MPRLLFVLLTVTLLTSADTQARTWRVEKDGSGDFTIVQDALDAAAPGDSVLIGPGRFATFRPGTSNADGFPFQMIAWVTTPDLTILGSGPDVTYLGPAVFIDEVEGRRPGALFLDEGAPAVVSGLTIENVPGEATIWSGSTLRDCRIVNPDDNTVAVTILGGHGAHLIDCSFIGADMIATGSRASGMVIENCRFVNDSTEGGGVFFSNGAQNGVVRGCTFEGGGGAIALSFGATGVVEDCVIRQTRASGIALSHSRVVVRRCTIGPGTRQPIFLRGGTLEIYDSEISGGTYATIGGSANLTMRNCHILNAGAWTVQTVIENSDVMDLSYNWWGTSDLTQIEAWIEDPTGKVIVEPILTGPVGTEATSIGELKARY